MSILGQEAQNVLNPALGSILLWRFVCGYAEGSKVRNPTPLPILFIVLPITLHQESAHFLISTMRKSGLRAFAGKFGESRNSKNDLLLEIHERSLKMRPLTMASLRLGISSKLFSIDPVNGVVIHLSLTEPSFGIPSSIKPMLKGAEKLGFWCSEISLHEISVILKVGF